MGPIVEMYSISNPRTTEGDWKDENGCDICGTVHSAYVGIQERGGMVIAICKGCLLNGVKLIDKELLNQSQTRT